MITATIRYQRLLTYNRKGAYNCHKRDGITDIVCLVLLYFFILGYIIGAVYSIISNVEPIYLLVASVFFFGGVFVYFAVQTQISMAEMLRGKAVEVMKTFVNAIDLKDAYTKGHSQHVYEIVDLFFDNLNDSYKRRINKSKLMDAAMLHDIGKISIRDDILNKQGALTIDEWTAIKTHPFNGKKMLDDTCFSEISDWVLYHHERVDGDGYFGLKGEEIPLESRIIAIADTYSALCTDRVYRKKRTHDEAIGIMEEVTGTQLDTHLMAFFSLIDKNNLTGLLD
ncbi:HD domain-containing protein [Brucepastera parasyntrophica]|uniref:HD-GYP domain-containing protein n=1 Tax=Brucepastera parasyntrophica TaxID=2880008 RepID=UPI00210D3334|nr:HD domain-containing phosphohydrolase [Brucepastera parasyntrophica]ULQ60216.1 HD domain-containing protein [Brucepastera parasyntrophica]